MGTQREASADALPLRSVAHLKLSTFPMTTLAELQEIGCQWLVASGQWFSVGGGAAGPLGSIASQVSQITAGESRVFDTGHSPFFCGDTRQSEAAWSRDRLLTPTIGIHKAIRA